MSYRIMCLTTVFFLCLFGSAVQAQPTLTKAIDADCPGDTVGSTDLAVEVGTETSDTYCFKVNYVGDIPVLVRDTLPAEWFLVDWEAGNGAFASSQANKKFNNKSSTKLGWTLFLDPPINETLTVQAETRCHEKRNNSKCKPTSCGALYLNNGAAAYELDEFGIPLVDEFGDLLPPIATSNDICLAAVADLGGDGIVGDGTGSEDGDEFSDWAEACIHGSDPCTYDTDLDQDGIPDSVDNCPDDANPSQEDGDEDGLGDLCDPCPVDPTNSCS